MIETSNIEGYRQSNFLISLKLIDTTDAKSGTYLMILDAEGISDAKIPSVKVGSKVEYVHIPSKASSNRITCAIYIRNEDNRSYPVVGTIYLSYHPSSGLVDITKLKISSDSQLNLYVDRIDNTKFDFRLKEK
ncbi:hypothetical protein FE394_01445 [Xenorhabdus sp. Reich]|uniref:Calcium-dependent cell adhesion molecule 1 membrane-binding domain-containing protein n=1 Tax=Xenorhabdus littoralis TaxID=2582835 RepID=A0ABU4SH45_9GAMM|nr:hypothetical protein [Xenorhabdus sp. Reich]MDX7997895.1 hypothetical protein [Xenorhabdus sp. Reich]